MKRFSRLWIFAAFAFVIALGQPRLWREAIWGKPTPRIVWTTSLLQARERAIREKKPLLLVFTAEWCGPCQEMTATTWQDMDVASLVNSKFVPALIDIDRQEKVAQHYGVMSIPSMVVQDAGREEIVAGASGYYGSPAFLRFTHDALTEATTPKKKRSPVGRTGKFPVLPTFLGLN